MLRIIIDTSQEKFQWKHHAGIVERVLLHQGIAKETSGHEVPCSQGAKGRHCTLQTYKESDEFSTCFASPGRSGAFTGGRSVPCTAQHHHNVQVLRPAPSFRSLASVFTGNRLFKEIQQLFMPYCKKSRGVCMAFVACCLGGFLEPDRWGGGFTLGATICRPARSRAQKAKAQQEGPTAPCCAKCRI